MADPSIIEKIIYGKGSEMVKVAFAALKNGRRTAERVKKAIKDSVQKKEGFKAFINRLEKAFHSSANDARRIARTETTRIENFARYEAGKEYREETKKQIVKTWVCTFHNSRESHIGLHDTTIPFDDDFQAAGGPMAYPGDGSRVGPEELCNCQCYMIVEKE